MFLKYFSSIFLGAQGCIAGHLPLAGNKTRWFLKYISESRVKKGKTTNNSDTVREYVKYNDGFNYWKPSFFSCYCRELEDRPCKISAMVQSLKIFAFFRSRWVIFNFISCTSLEITLISRTISGIVCLLFC